MQNCENHETFPTRKFCRVQYFMHKRHNWFFYNILDQFPYRGIGLILIYADTRTGAALDPVDPDKT